MMGKSGLAQIRASAGSGKTWRLTTEYIENLAEASGRGRIDSATAQSVLAVTFTNAAAEEMRERVLRRLKEEHLAGGADAGKWLDIFLREPGALNIRTIDSVLAQIVRASALGLGISPDFQIEFDTAALLAPHVELVMENARKPGPERELLKGACKAVLDFEKTRGFGAGKKILEPLQKVLEETLGGKYDALASMEEIKAAYDSLPDQASAAASRLLQLAPTGDPVWKSAYEWKAVAKIASKDFTKSFPAVAQKEIDELFKQAVPEEIRQATAAFKKAVEDLYHGGEILKRGMRLRPFIELASQVTRSFSEAQGQTGAPQILMPIWANSALAGQAGVSEALLRMGTRLAHFLVDEFQDTSAEQWRVLQAVVLEALSKGGSFTWVGDIKQSIYSWRGGDARLFGAPLRDPALKAVAPVPSLSSLEKNWRSLPGIVEHTNSFFESLATQAGAEDAAAVLLGARAPGKLKREAAARLQEAFADVRQECANAKAAATGFVLAEEIAADPDSDADPICERVCDTLLNDIGQRRPWSDVLVLVRSNKQARALSEALSEAGVPVITENGLLLNENQLVIQTIALLRFINDPRDDVAFWTLITGSIFAGHPLASFGPESGLAGWAARRDKNLAVQFARDFPDAWDNLIAPFYRRKGLMTAYDTASEWLSHMEVKKRFPEDVTMVTRLLEAIYRAEKEGNTTIAAFLDYWQAVNGEEKAPAPEKMNAVRIMTIHKAKGLEAPVVIVPGMDYPILAPKKPIICHVGDTVVATNCVADIGETYRKEIMRQGLEALNLVYVALTRPKEELYLFLAASGTVSTKNLKGTIRHLIETAGLRLPYSSGTRKSAPEGHMMELANQALPQAAGEPVAPEPGWRPMKWLPRLRIYHTELATPHLTPRQRGVVLHTCLEYLNFDRDHEAAAMAALASGLSASTIFVPEKERQGLLDALLWLMENAPLEDWLERGLREQPFTDEDGEILRADMIVPEPWGPLVVDYKSGEPHAGDEAQIRKYMDTLALSGEYPGVPCGLLIYLDKKCFRKIGSHKSINLSKETPGKPGSLTAPAAGSRFSSTLPTLP